MNGFTRPLASGLVVLAACNGRGSDVGPVLDRLPDASCKVLVLDDDNRGVSAANVVTGAITAVTGRSGRTDLLADLRGEHVLFVSGAAAAAVAGDLLPDLRVREVFAGQQLAKAVHLPDLSGSVGVELGFSVPGITVLDDTATSGARIEIPVGALTGAPPGLTSRYTLRTGSVTTEHLPGTLPTADSGARIFSRGIFVHDSTANFQPAATLEIPDDLQLVGGATASLFRLDQTSGSWVQVAGTATSGAGRLRMTEAVTTFGIYAFAVDVAAVATVRGRVVDAVGAPLPCVLVHAGEARAETDSDGRFLLRLGATMADGSARTVQLELHGGRCYLPITAVIPTALPVGGGELQLGDVRLDTLPAGNLRVQMISRGRGDPFRRLAMSSLDGNVTITALGDERGQATFEDLPQGWFGFTTGSPLDARQVLLGQAVGFQQFGRRWTDISQFALDTFWFLGARNSRTQALDWRGGGPVRGAAIVKGAVPDAGFVQFTREGGLVIANRAFDGRATAAVRTTGDGRTVTSAFTIVDPNGEHLEMPLQRADLTAPGQFDRHGVLQGALTGVALPSTLRVRSTRPLTPAEWFDDVFLGVPVAVSLPVDVDPAVTGDPAFRIGIGLPLGQMAGVQGTTNSGDFTLERVGIVRGLATQQGTIVERDLALAAIADSTFVAAGAATGLDALLTGNDLQFDLALGTDDGLVTDVVRGVGGNHTIVGSDLQFRLPALTGGLAGGEWLVGLRATTTASGQTIAQHTLHRLRADTTAATVPFLAVPTIAEPVPDAVVPANGFTVRWTPPTDADYVTLELRHAVGAEQATWTAVVPGHHTEFAFVRLPSQAPTPLVAGRTYTLTVTAFRVDAGPYPTDPQLYRNVTTFWLSVEAFERGVTAVASRSFQITTG
ncbi:MAG: hypothetical protein IPK26_22665 [Planctomycetes bacterium]|nr:hypothetical protein [Planctomycetota bacterium]